MIRHPAVAKALSKASRRVARQVRASHGGARNRCAVRRRLRDQATIRVRIYGETGRGETHRGGPVLAIRETPRA